MSRDSLVALVERQRSQLTEMTTAQDHFAGLSNQINRQNTKNMGTRSKRRGGPNRLNSEQLDEDTRTAVDEASDSGPEDGGNPNSSNSSDEAPVKRRRILYNDPGVSASTLMHVFINRNSFLFPTGRPPVDAAASTAYFNSFKSKSAFRNLLRSDINTLTEAFSYGVAFALGAKAVSRWSLVKDFIFRTNNKLLEKILKKDLGTQQNSSLYVRVNKSSFCSFCSPFLPCSLSECYQESVFISCYTWLVQISQRPETAPSSLSI